jgi:Sigma-70, region 4
VEDTISRSNSADMLRELNDRSSRLGPTMPTMAPDQRAALELVLRQGRSYGELADLLGMPEETIRVRARGGASALAPDLATPSRAGEIVDWLLGQQSEAHGTRTRALLLNDPEALYWAGMVASALRMFPGGERVPELPTGPDEPARRVNGTSREAAGGAGDGGGDAPPIDATGEPGGRSSRLRGAILIGAAVVLVVGVLAFVLLRDHGGNDDPVASSGATATATATATPQSLGYVELKGPAGSTSLGAMQLLRFTDNTVRFALAAQGVAPNKSGETYSLWFSKKDGTSQLLGDVKDPVGEKGELTSAGPGNDDVDKFPQWFATYDTILVTLDGKNAKAPGKVILSGDLPHSQTG